MASSADIKALYDHFSGLVFILQSIQSCLGDCENYMKPMPGSDSMQAVLDFQSSLNIQLKNLHDAIDQAYQQMDMAMETVNPLDKKETPVSSEE